MKLTSILAVLLVAIFAITACTPQATPTTVPMPQPTAIPEPMLKDIVDTAVADGRFGTLAAALTAADLIGTLKGAGPFTVFAPTDDAFAKLPAGTLETLLKAENLEQLKSILLYHVVSGKVMAADVVKLSSADAVSGEMLTIKVVDGKVFLNETIQVIITDVEASNGIIHVIDAVLLPPAPAVTLSDAEMEALITEKAKPKHTLEFILSQNKTAEEWSVTLDRMVGNGAKINAEEKQLIINWLVGRK